LEGKGRRITSWRPSWATQKVQDRLDNRVRACLCLCSLSRGKILNYIEGEYKAPLDKAKKKKMSLNVISSLFAKNSI
jgi:hypothetical protein